MMLSFSAMCLGTLRNVNNRHYKDFRWERELQIKAVISHVVDIFLVVSVSATSVSTTNNAMKTYIMTMIITVSTNYVNFNLTDLT